MATQAERLAAIEASQAAFQAQVLEMLQGKAPKGKTRAPREVIDGTLLAEDALAALPVVGTTKRGNPKSQGLIGDWFVIAVPAAK